MDPTTLQEIEWWLGQLAKGRDGTQFDGPGFMRPYHFATLASEVHRVRAVQLTISPPLQNYSARMRLWQSIDLPPPTTVNERNPGGRFHPLTPIVSEATAEAVADGVVEVFRTAGTTDPATLKAVGVALSEIFGNAFFHAEAKTKICGLACAQSWPAAQLAQVAVADIGVGIRASLQANPAHHAVLEQRSAPELATELGVTGKPQGKHSGYGLTVARQLMERYGGRFYLVSGQEAFCAREHGAEARKLQVPWNGTMVVLEWHTNRPLDIGPVYASWPKTGDSDDFF
jgi:anti-sigma regulatory factor (Ser/Thr protein kinase)